MGKKLHNEKEVIERAKQNPVHFAPLYKHYHEPIYRFVYQRMTDKTSAADITQQVFIKALNHIHKFEHRGFPFSSWLYRIAANEVNGYYRKANRNRMFYAENDELKDLKGEIYQSADESHNEQFDVLISLLQNLEEKDLILIEMRFFEQRAFREIAEILGITENNAKVRTYRVLDKMKKAIE